MAPSGDGFLRVPEPLCFFLSGLALDKENPAKKDCRVWIFGKGLQRPARRGFSL